MIEGRIVVYICWMMCGEKKDIDRFKCVGARIRAKKQCLTRLRLFQWAIDSFNVGVFLMGLFACPGSCGGRVWSTAGCVLCGVWGGFCFLLLRCLNF